MSADLSVLKGAQETLLSTLYGKAIDYHSKTPIVGDEWSADIVDRIGKLGLLARMSAGDRFLTLIRARRMDGWTRDFLDRHPSAVVVQLACGLDSRPYRMEIPETVEWYDVDFPEVVGIRRTFYPEREHHHLIGSSVTESGWLEQIPDDRPTLVIAEGLFMYLTEDHVRDLLARLLERFPRGEMIFDLVRPWFAKSARLARLKMWGCADPGVVERWHPDLKLLEVAPVVPEYDLIGPRGYRAYYALLNRWSPLRELMLPLRFSFTHEPPDPVPGD